MHLYNSSAISRAVRAVLDGELQPVRKTWTIRAERWSLSGVLNTADTQVLLQKVMVEDLEKEETGSIKKGSNILTGPNAKPNFAIV